MEELHQTLGERLKECSDKMKDVIDNNIEIIIINNRHKYRRKKDKQEINYKSDVNNTILKELSIINSELIELNNLIQQILYQDINIIKDKEKKILHYKTKYNRLKLKLKRVNRKY